MRLKSWAYCESPRLEFSYILSTVSCWLNSIRALNNLQAKLPMRGAQNSTVIRAKISRAFGTRKTPPGIRGPVSFEGGRVPTIVLLESLFHDTYIEINLERDLPINVSN